MSSLTLRSEYDVVVVGAGPAGSVVAAELARAGRSVLLLERHRFPRYRIGESLTVSAGDLVREWGLVEDMQRLDFPEKTGVKVIGRSARSEFYVPVLRPTWQVRRAEFDELLLDRALEAGAELRWGSVKAVHRDGDRVVGVGFRPYGHETDLLTDVAARVVVDASGHSTLLSHHGVAGRRTIDAFGRQIAMFTQFPQAVRDPGSMGNNTFIFYGSKYHWAWFIPLSSTLTSVGVVLPAATVKEVGGPPEEVMAWGLQNVNPDLHRRVRGLVPTEPVRVVRNYSYRVDPFVGDGWLCVGDAHRFADPIFSFGVSFAMTEARAAAQAVLDALGSGDCRAPFEDYASFSNRGQDAALDLIRYFWKFPAFFSFQTRGATRHEMIRLLGGDCFGPDEIGVLASMRRSLHEVTLTQGAQQRAQAIANRVYARYADFQGVEATFIGVDEVGIELAFVLAEDDPALSEQVAQFEASLYDEFGRDDLAVFSFAPSVLARLPVRSGHPLRGNAALTIFDRRAA